MRRGATPEQDAAFQHQASLRDATRVRRAIRGLKSTATISYRSAIKALRFTLALLLLTLALLFRLPTHAAESTPLALLTNVQQVLDLGVEGARRSPHPVKLTGVVTYPFFNPKWIYVQDKTAGVLIVHTNAGPQPSAGQFVEISGHAGPGAFAAHVFEADVRVIGTAPLPDPIRTGPARLETGADFGQWVALEGRVVDIFKHTEQLSLLIAAGDHRFVTNIRLDAPMQIPMAWLGVRVEVRGVCWTITSSAGNKPVGFRVHSPGTNSIRFLEPIGTRLFARPLQTVKALQASSHPVDARVRLVGNVTLFNARSQLFLQDDSGPARVRILTPLWSDAYYSSLNPLNTLDFASPNLMTVNRAYLVPLQPGDRVEVIGTPLPSAFAPTLVDAEYRLLEHSTPPAPASVTMGDLHSGVHDGQLVSLRARLIDRVTRQVGSSVLDLLMLESDGKPCQATLAADHTNALPALERGSFLQLTGVCSMDAGEWKTVRSATLLLREASDVRVVGGPPLWAAWNVGRILVVAGALGVAALAWITLLRRRVAQRTAALAASEAHTRLIIDTALDAVVTMDVEGNVCGWSAQAEKIFGWTRAEAMGRTVAELIIPECYREAHTRGLKHLLATGQGTVVNRRIEISALRKDGREFPVELSIVAMKSNGAWNFSAFARDISERKRAEAELLKALAQEQELSQLKSNFVNLVSHEFRTPLGIIMSATENLEHYLERLQPAERAELLADIRTSTQRMSGLMQEVLLLARVDAGKLACRPAPLDLRAFLERLTEEVRSASDHACVIELHLAADAATAQADEALLRHMFTNLLSNAVKYSPLGQPVYFRAEREGDAAVFTVRDGGIGIPEADQKQLFQTFHRGSNVGERPGTGLGLVIVKRCVDLHGGTLQLESKLNGGTSVTVRLPLFGAVERSLS